MQRKSAPRRSTKPIARRTPPKKRSPKFGEKWARQFHSVARVEFVKARPCEHCGVTGHSENAHIHSKPGMGRRGHYTQVIALCGPFYLNPRKLYVGCHRRYDLRQIDIPDADVKAAHTELDWLRYSDEKANLEDVL